LLDDLVAARIAEQIVDRLHAVEIEQAHGKCRIPALTRLREPPELFMHAHLVAKAGQWIGIGQRQRRAAILRAGVATGRGLHGGKPAFLHGDGSKFFLVREGRAQRWRDQPPQKPHRHQRHHGWQEGEVPSVLGRQHECCDNRHEAQSAGGNRHEEKRPEHLA
jgi:hypothetical protein